MLVWKLKSWGHHFTQSWFFKERNSDAISLNAAASGRGGQRRVRSWRIQRQRHGTDPGDHGGGPGNAVAGDRAGEPRRSRLFAGPLPVSPDDRGDRSLSGAADRTAPGSRQQRGNVQERD